MSPDSFGTTIFCDDIRPEGGNKISLMGIYTGEMLLSGAFPVTLPKFGIFVRYFEKPGIFTGDLTVQIYLPGDQEGAPTIYSAAPLSTLRADVKKPEDLGLDDEHRFDLQMPFLMAPLVLKEPGLIKVRGICDSVITHLGVLRVQRMPQT